MRHRTRKYLFLLLKIIIIAISYAYIWNRLKHRPADDLWPEENASFLYFFMAFALMPINWIIESVKWQYLLAKTEKIHLLRALQSVFAGVTVGIFTPNRIGDLAGRIIILEKEHQIKGVLAAGAGSFAQSLTTLILGLIGMFFVWHHGLAGSEGFTEGYPYLASLLTVLTLAVLFLYFKLDEIAKYFGTRRIPKKIKNALSVLSSYSSLELLRVLLYSGLRYFVFVLQLYFLMRFFNVEIPVLYALSAAAASFLINAAVPSIALADIGIRSSSALFFFGFFSDNDSGILAAGFLLWLINLVLPAVIGSLVLLRNRFRK